MTFQERAPPTDSFGQAGAAHAGTHVEREARTKVFLAAQLMIFGETPRDVRVRDLSATGARIDLASPPAVGVTVLLSRGGAEVAGEVIWIVKGGCGLRFSRAIDVAQWRSDRPSATAAAVAREPSLAEDIALARRLVARLENALGEEPAVVAALGTELQALDLLAQLLATSEKRAQGSTVPTIRNLLQAIAAFMRTT